MPMQKKMKPITMREYHRLAMRTSPMDGHDKVDNGMLGPLGETGELVDILKKHKYQSTPNAPWPVDRIADELGDVLWHLEEMADGLGTTMEVVSGMSFADLDTMTRAVRFPNIERAILNLSTHAHNIRKAVRRKDRKTRDIQMRRMLHAAAYLARMISMPIEEVARRNIEKLMRRYPDGFSAAASMARYAKEKET